MNFKSLRSVLPGVLLIPFTVWLFLVWVPMMRRDNQAIENADKAIRDSKQTIEKTKAEMERIEKTTPPMPRIPAGNEQVI